MLHDLFKIIHWKSILVVILLLCVVKFYFLNNFGFVTPLSYTNFFLLLIAVLFVFLGSYFIIFYFAREEKLKNIARKKILISYLILISIGISIGFYISFQTAKPLNSLIFIIISLFMFFYAKETKRKTLINNFVLAFIIPTSLTILWWVDSPLTLNNSKEWKIYLNLEIIIIYTMVVTFAAVFVKSLFVDIVKLKKDTCNKHRTLPIVLGEKATLKVAFHITLSVAITANFLIFYLISDTYIPVTIFLFLSTPQVYGAYRIKKAKNIKDYIFLIKFINIAIFTGLFLFPLMAYSIKNAS